MIAEGVLRDRMARRCAERGIPFAAGVLADTGSLTRLVLDRVDAPGIAVSPACGVDLMP
jgi:hypothetical protein